jgi:hypothetical protein
VNQTTAERYGRRIRHVETESLGGKAGRLVFRQLPYHAIVILGPRHAGAAIGGLHDSDFRCTGPHRGVDGCGKITFVPRQIRSCQKSLQVYLEQ